MKNQKKNEIPDNIKKIKPKDELVILINNLNTVIKTYYINTMQIILNLKDNIMHKGKNNINEVKNIEKNLFYFIKNAKDLFNKMKLARKQSLLAEEKAKKNHGHLYNYCNNNFFYYSNGPTNLNTNPNYFTKISNYGRHQKINYKSPTNNSNNNLKHDKFMNTFYLQHSYQKLNNNSNNNTDNILINNNSNNITNILPNKEINNKINIPKLNIEKRNSKDELIKNLLNLLKKLNTYNCKIFYETEEAQSYKSIFYKILEELNKLIEILSKDKINFEIKCLTERILIF